VTDNAKRQVVGLNPIFNGKFLKPWGQSPVASDNTADQALMSQVIESFVAVIARACSHREKKRQIPWLAGGKETLLQGQSDLLANPHPCKATEGDRVSIEYDRDSLLRGYDFIFSHVCLILTKVRPTLLIVSNVRFCFHYKLFPPWMPLHGELYSTKSIIGNAK
jgi:hypothetical protein